MHLPIEVTHAFQLASAQLEPIFLYIKTHKQAHYIIIGIALILVGILLLDVKPKKVKTNPVDTKKLSALSKMMLNKKDFNAIAGDDVVTTQLDLAKAYIEMDQKKLAKQLLDQVVKQGSNTQKQEARKLIKAL